MKNISAKIYAAIFTLFLILIIFVIPFQTAERGKDLYKEVTPFSEGWELESGEKANVDELRPSEYDGEITIKKTLPDDISNDDAVCFESRNTNLEVYINNHKRYEFKSRPNLTGLGYGVAYHEVGLEASDAGAEIRLAYRSIHKDNRHATICGIYLGASTGYIRMVINKALPACLLCLITVLLGLFLLLIHVLAQDKDILPFDVFALGITAVIIGTWLFLDSNIMQAITGRILIWRDMSRILPFLIIYPLSVFFSSLSSKKRSIYMHIGFWGAVSFTTGIVIARYAFNVDMSYSFSRFLLVYLLFMAVVLCAILTDNYLYCRKMGIQSRYKSVYVGIAILFTCGVMDLLAFFFMKIESNNVGKYTRLGSLFFIVLMLKRFLQWWMKDHEDIERDRFINRALQYALSSNSPDISIHSMLKFLGTEFEAERLFIFEDQKNGRYRGTYEWYAEGKESAYLDLVYFPYSGFVDELKKEFSESNNRLIVEDSEKYMTENPQLYNFMLSNNLTNMVLGPLEVNGHMFGMCGVSGVPQKSLSSVAEIMNLISYFLAQLILQREEQNRVLFYNYNDVLSGAKNYIAYRKYVEEQLDKAMAFGFVRCDMEGLDEINVTEGYEVGDQIIVVTAKCLMEVFGDKNVYRINGTQFMAFGFETDEIFFNNDVERAKRMIKENSINAVIASVYCLYGTKDMGIVLKRVDDLIMKEREQMK